MPLTSVPGQVSAGAIDGYLRDDAGDGTLGLPDYSRVPYTYAPLLGDVASVPSWSVDQFRLSNFAGFKGSPDGYGALRSTGSPRGSSSIAVIPGATGVKRGSPDGSRAPDYTWGPRDFVIAVRHPGTASWTAAASRAYLAFTQETNSVGMRLTTSAALGPWDAELADSAAVVLGGTRPNLWDGNAHTMSVGTFGQHVFCLIDGVFGVPFRLPRAYKRNASGATDTTVFANLPSTGDYIGYDCRGAANSLWAWEALQPVSGDFFFYDMGPTAVQPVPTTTATPSVLPSGETWTITGTATASKDGVTLGANSTMTFTPAGGVAYGRICTRWSTSVAEGGVVFRRQDASNYYLVTSTGLYRSVAGALTKIATFAIPNGADVVIYNSRYAYDINVNGVQVVTFTSTTFVGAPAIGFQSPAAGTSQFRYIAFQPMVNAPTMPTT